MKVLGIGVDATEIARFRALLTGRKAGFIKNTFSSVEEAYCRSFKDPAPHLAGTFAAKEAVRKASGDISLPLSALEIRRDAHGAPTLWVKGKRSKNVLISITHTKTLACATAIHQGV